MTLLNAVINSEYIIDSVDDILVPRAYALGWFPKVSITLLRYAPLGDPVQVRIGPSTFSIRKAEASHIHIKKK
jgi:Fe2+ transport system protein FeoA